MVHEGLRKENRNVLAATNAAATQIRDEVRTARHKHLDVLSTGPKIASGVHSEVPHRHPLLGPCLNKRFRAIEIKIVTVISGQDQCRFIPATMLLNPRNHRRKGIVTTEDCAD